MAVHRRHQPATKKLRQESSTSRGVGFTLSELGLSTPVKSAASPALSSRSAPTNATTSLFESVVGYPLSAVWGDLTRALIIFILVCCLIGAVSLSPLL